MKYVIDADILRSAGDSEAPVSSLSRELLRKILESGDEACFCQKLWDEWKKHNSNYSKGWRASMVAKRKMIKVETTNETESHLLTLNDSKEKSAAIKDCHLIEIAIAADKIIFSNDGKAKTAFSNLLDDRDKFKKIYWMSPTNDFDDIESYAMKNKIIPDLYEI